MVEIERLNGSNYSHHGALGHCKVSAPTAYFCRYLTVCPMASVWRRTKGSPIRDSLHEHTQLPPPRLFPPRLLIPWWPLRHRSCHCSTLLPIIPGHNHQGQTEAALGHSLSPRACCSDRWRSKRRGWHVPLG